MKFKDIAVGDTVYYPERVDSGWRTGKTFFIKGEVERITATQFTVNGVRAKKDDGSIIGESSFAYILKEGDTIGGYDSKQIVYDQSEERDAFISLINKKNRVSNLRYDLYNKLRPCPTEHLDKVEELLKEVIELIGKEEEEK